MNDSRLIKSIRLRNLLSFGPDNEELELKPLNVLIGPNASGKSNFIDAISVLRATTGDLTLPMRSGGGIREWAWKGKRIADYAMIEVIVSNILRRKGKFLKYNIDLIMYGEPLLVDMEVIEPEEKRTKEDFFFRNKNGNVELNMKVSGGRKSLNFQNNFDISQSILSQYEDSFSNPELSSLKHKLREIKIFRNWDVNKEVLKPQQTDLPSVFLSEDISNFALILNDLKERRETKDLLIEKLRLFYNDVDYIRTEIKGGTVQLFIYEKGLKEPIPATRLSDGTINYLCLLAILCHPEPPPLICIEEPEIGLHPDIMPTIAELLIDASKRTQLIVTTHSDVLVSALTETPESVVVCEHDDDGTHMRRLEKDKLEAWLEKYSLGDLWLKGEIGGTRW